MTGYHISIGYLSGSNKAEAWEALKQFIAGLCSRPQEIAAEAHSFGMPAEEAVKYASYYSSFSPETGRTEDSTLVILEADPQDAESYGQVTQLASGGGEMRSYKEAMRRAMCRLIIKEMHKQALEVNLNVS